MSIWSADNLFKLGAGLYSARQQYKAGKRAESIAEDNAHRAKMEAEEEARRLSRSQRRNQSSLRARAAASGIKLSGSTKTYLDEYVDEDSRQLDWQKKSGKSREGLIRKQGKDQKKTAQYGAYGSFFNTMSSWWDS